MAFAYRVATNLSEMGGQRQRAIGVFLIGALIPLASCGGGTAEHENTTTVEPVTTEPQTTIQATTTTVDPLFASGTDACAHVEEKIYFNPYGWDIYDVKADAEIDFGKQIGGTSYGIDGYLRRSFRKYINVYENAAQLTSNPDVLLAFRALITKMRDYLDEHSQIPYPDFEPSFDRQIIDAVAVTKTACDKAKQGPTTNIQQASFTCSTDQFNNPDLVGGRYSAPPNCIKDNSAYRMNLDLYELNGGVGGMEAETIETRVTLALDSKYSHNTINDIVTLVRNRLYQGNMIESRRNRASFDIQFSTGDEVFRPYKVKAEGQSSGVFKGALVYTYDETDSTGGPTWFIAMSSDVSIQGRYAVVGAVTSGFNNLVHHLDETVPHGERSTYITISTKSGSCCSDVASLVNLTK